MVVGTATSVLNINSSASKNTNGSNLKLAETAAILMHTIHFLKVAPFGHHV